MFTSNPSNRTRCFLLAGSLLGVQLGAIGTTLVKEHMIKVVMGTIMLIVALSRALAIPRYLTQLGLMSTGASILEILDTVSFITMCLALAVGAVIILGSMFKAKRAEYAATIGAQTYEHV